MFAEAQLLDLEVRCAIMCLIVLRCKQRGVRSPGSSGTFEFLPFTPQPVQAIAASLGSSMTEQADEASSPEASKKPRQFAMNFHHLWRTEEAKHETMQEPPRSRLDVVQVPAPAPPGAVLGGEVLPGIGAGSQTQIRHIGPRWLSDGFYPRKTAAFSKPQQSLCTLLFVSTFSPSHTNEPPSQTRGFVAGRARRSFGGAALEACSASAGFRPLFAQQSKIKALSAC